MHIISNILAVSTLFATLTFTTIMKKEINVSQSQVQWTGKKITGSHTGTINFKSGYLTMTDNQLTGGQFVIDMSTINVTDLSGDSKTKLEGHLKSDDFFGVEAYPTSTLNITSATPMDGGYSVIADITIKGKTEPISFNLLMSSDTANATVIIDRTKFGVRYGSGSFFDNLGDNTIYDNFELNVNLQF